MLILNLLTTQPNQELKKNTYKIKTFYQTKAAVTLKW